MMPFKLLAWKSNIRFFKRLVIMITKPIDFLLIWVNNRNGILLIYEKAYGGPFFFGEAYMETDFTKTESEIVLPSTSSENFMGLSIVSSEADVFASNSGILHQNEPLRTCTRNYLDEHVFQPERTCLAAEHIKVRCADAFRDWKEGDGRDTMLAVRAQVTRIFIKVLTDYDLDQETTRRVTKNYIRSFLELCMFGRYMVFISDLLGSRQRLREKVFLPLKERGINTMAVDVTMFAAMFSVGTMVLNAIEDARRFDIDYASLNPKQKRHFLIEVMRVFPTVNTVDRIVETPTEVTVKGLRIQLQPGDEIAYPFVCSNRDPKHFKDPDNFRIDRSDEEYEKVLSWSKGPHGCPAKEIALQSGIAMLDELTVDRDLRSIRIFNPIF